MNHLARAESRSGISPGLRLTSARRPPAEASTVVGQPLHLSGPAVNWFGTALHCRRGRGQPVSTRGAVVSGECSTAVGRVLHRRRTSTYLPSDECSTTRGRLLHCRRRSSQRVWTTSQPLSDECSTGIGRPSTAIGGGGQRVRTTSNLPSDESSTARGQPVNYPRTSPPVPSDDHSTTAGQPCMSFRQRVTRGALTLPAQFGSAGTAAKTVRE